MRRTWLRVAVVLGLLCLAAVGTLILILPSLLRSWGVVPSDRPELTAKYAPVVDAAAALVEKHKPFNVDEPSVVAFRKKYPCVIAMFLVVDPKNRILLMREKSEREYIDLRARPYAGTLHYADGSSRQFLEFQRDCKYGEGSVTLHLRVDETKPIKAPVAKSQEGGPFTFVQLCDTQLGFGGYQHDVDTFRQAVEQINALKPDFVVICGDLVNKRDHKSFADFKKIRDELSMPCHCAAGNHDVGNKPTAASLKSYRQVMGKDYYSFGHKGYTFVITNTQLWKSPLEAESEKHDAWVTKTLKQAKEKRSPVFVVAHYPLYVKNPEEGDKYYNLPLEKRRELLALYEQCGVVAVLAGHTHRTIVSTYKGIQLVNGESTSKNFDKRPLGFRLWKVAPPAPATHEFVPLTR